MMSLRSKMEYLQSIYERYHKSARDMKSRILDEFCKVCKYHRKHALRLLNAAPPEKRQKKERKGRRLYSSMAISALEAIWKASGYLCSQRLKEALPLWLPFARKRFKLTPKVEQEMLRISPRQIDNRLKDKKRQLKKRIYCTTRPGSLLKSKIPIRTHNWDIKKPGYLEIDLVAHCGNSGSGQFIYTLDATDIRTGWTERVSVLGKGQDGIIQGLSKIRRDLPFRLRGIDSDNGEEFINYALLEFCLQFIPRIEFTRGRPYKKDDNAHVEQKNWTHVRQIFGWDRYDTEASRDAMNDLYANELRLFQNFFQPSMKLKKKVRVGSRLSRKYDRPQTPFQRVLKSGQYHRARMKQLKEQFSTLDPFELSEAIDRKLQATFKLASERIRPSPRLKLNSKQAQDGPHLKDRKPGHVLLPKKNPWKASLFNFSRKINRRRKMLKNTPKSFRKAA